MYLFLNCRAALDNLRTVACDSLQFITSDFKSFYLPQLFLVSLHKRGRLEDQNLISTNKASFYPASQLYLLVFLMFRDSHYIDFFKTNTLKGMLSRLLGKSLTYFFPL